VVDVTDADFATAVLEESRRRPVVVDFWAEWCQPCKTLGPVLEKVAEEHGGEFLLAKLDVDANQRTAQQFRVMSIPNVWAFVDGEAVDQFVGAVPEPVVREWIGRLLPTEADRGASLAMEAEREGRLDEAERGYREALQEDPANATAKLGLARVLAGGERFDEARELAAALVPDPEAERLLAAIRVSEWAALPSATRLDEARRSASEGRWEEALERMLAVVRDDPEARQSMLDVFAVLGDDDPLVREYRQRLATALF
jgi:putative thioredoxin